MLGLNAPMGAPYRLPLTSYANPGGSDDRTGSITVTCSANIAGMIYSAPLSNLVDGGFGANASDAVDFFSAGFVDNDWITFDFGVKKYISEFTAWFDRTIDWGVWIARASADNLVWKNLNSFSWTGASGPNSQVVHGMSAEGSRFFGLRKIGATNGIAPYLMEINFKVSRG